MLAVAAAAAAAAAAVTADTLDVLLDELFVVELELDVSYLQVDLVSRIDMPNA